MNTPSVDDDGVDRVGEEGSGNGEREGAGRHDGGIDEWNDDDMLTFFPLIFCSISDTTATAPAAATAATAAASPGPTGHKAAATATPSAT